MRTALCTATFDQSPCAGSPTACSGPWSTLALPPKLVRGCTLKVVQVACVRGVVLAVSPSVACLVPVCFGSRLIFILSTGRLQNADDNCSGLTLLPCLRRHNGAAALHAGVHTTGGGDCI